MSTYTWVNKNCSNSKSSE